LSESASSPSIEVKHEFNDRMIPKLKLYLATLLEKGGSDLHLKAEGKVYGRMQGDMEIIADELLSRKDMMDLTHEILRSHFDTFVAKKEIDLVFRLNDEFRFRVNMFFQKDGVSAVFRRIPVAIPTLDELGMLPSIKELTKLKRGLVLVTGVTGSGKSTTLSAMINEINEHQKKHIITVEDPIEFIHKDKNSIMNQRSIGEDTLSFSTALRSSLREDPDVILIGEMRDLETIEIALHAAETGHLVFSTLHTADTTETISRIISVFPGAEQNRIRTVLSGVLSGVLSQRLVRGIDGKRCAAVEILVKTPRIEDLIRKNRDSEIKETLFDGKAIYGTQTFDQALYDMYTDGKISEDEALANASSPDNLKLLIHGVGGVSSGSSVKLDAGEPIQSEIKLKIN
jgi:twitching motility protein PilT